MDTAYIFSTPLPVSLVKLNLCNFPLNLYPGTPYLSSDLSLRLFSRPVRYRTENGLDRTSHIVTPLGRFRTTPLVV